MAFAKKKLAKKGEFNEILNLPYPFDPMGFEYAEYFSYSHACIAGLCVRSYDQAAPECSAGLFRFPVNA